MSLKNMSTDQLLDHLTQVKTELTERRDRISIAIDQQTGKIKTVITVPLDQETTTPSGKTYQRFIITKSMLRKFAKLRANGHTYPEIVKLLHGFKLRSCSYWQEKAKRFGIVK